MKPILSCTRCVYAHLSEDDINYCKQTKRDLYLLDLFIFLLYVGT